MTLPARYAAFDLETTGLDPYQDSIIEIGGVVVEDGRAVSIIGSLVHPGERESPQDVQVLTGITPAMVATAPPVEEAVKGLPLVCHNAYRFDIPFLRRVPAAAQLADARVLDTAGIYKAWRMGWRPRDDEDHVSYAVGALATRKYGLSYTLASCCSLLNVPTNELRLHRAQGDAMATHLLLQEMHRRGIAIPRTWAAWRP